MTSKVNIGVVPKMKKCHFASLFPSHCAMCDLTDRLQELCGLGSEAGLWLLSPVFSYPRPSGTFVSPS